MNDHNNEMDWARVANVSEGSLCCGTWRTNSAQLADTEWVALSTVANLCMCVCVAVEIQETEINYIICMDETTDSALAASVEEDTVNVYGWMSGYIHTYNSGTRNMGKSGVYERPNRHDHPNSNEMRKRRVV